MVAAFPLGQLYCHRWEEVKENKQGRRIEWKKRGEKTRSGGRLENGSKWMHDCEVCYELWCAPVLYSEDILGWMIQKCMQCYCIKTEHRTPSSSEKGLHCCEWIFFGVDRESPQHDMGLCHYITWSLYVIMCVTFKQCGTSKLEFNITDVFTCLKK